ncbi:hypothetical protein CC86DRAFT_462770 [Ophiobolus disseminans]|uniref:Nephrocystin 3-like N-terminal domain-containing protein n=1 Tax=Ophiobolus disseminans TaxID=1469910 RepID=A0A6A7AH03_9PLEO|nr:hypothetical protein CC86DRAFT_462770 [Ophiobolus disseminans]
MQILIVEVFDLTIKFRREIILYFTKHPLERVRHAILPSESKTKTVPQLRIKLAEIRKEVEIVLLEKLHRATTDLEDMNSRLKEMQLTNKDIQATGLDTNVRVQENQSRLRQDANLKEKNRFLSDVKSQLHLKAAKVIPLAVVVKTVSSVLKEEFSNHGRRRRGVPQQMSPIHLERDDTFSTWMNCEGSTMRVLAGSNFVDDTSIPLKWLSYASVWTAENMRHTGHVLAAFCQTSYTVTKRNRRNFPDIIKSLIYQLAEQHPSGLRSQREEIAEALNSPLWTHVDQNVAFEEMTKTLCDLMACFAEGSQMTLILDRLDQCCWSSNPDCKVGALDAPISSLLDVVRSGRLLRLRVKILLVMDHNPAKHIPSMFEWAVVEGWLPCKVNWDQPTCED